MLKNLFMFCIVLTTGCLTSGLHEHDLAEKQAFARAPLLSSARLPTQSEITKAKNKHRKAHPECEVCQAKSNISNGNKNDVHHKIPVHINPSLAADPSNLITLCRRHHFWVGHTGSWHRYNGNVINTAEILSLGYHNNVHIKQ